MSHRNFYFSKNTKEPTVTSEERFAGLAILSFVFVIAAAGIFLF